MASLDLAKLEHYMRVFGRMLTERSGATFDSFSGNSYLQEQEGYKGLILAEAQRSLAVAHWDESMLAKGGVIGKLAIKAMAQSGNLVHYQQRLHFGNVVAEHREAAERALYDIYRSPDAQAAFEQATGIFGAKYDLISYLFFLKDGGRYLPVRPTFFDNYFRVLGVDLRMSGRCTWENYTDYLGAMAAIRNHLDSFFGFDVPPTLLDAHSFVWMADVLEAYEAEMPANEPVVSVEPVSKDTAGITKQRIGQERFRKALIDYWGGRCAVTSCADLRVLVASHIKPWRVCTVDNEWLNPYNGILLTPNLDSLFDGGLISFTDDGDIILSPQLDEDEAEKLGVSRAMRLRKMDPRHRPFLQYHRENVLLP